MAKCVVRSQLERIRFHPAALIIAVLFVGSKLWSNVSYGGSVATGLRSGLMGLIVYALALGLIAVLSKPDSEPFSACQVDQAKLRSGLIWILACYALMLMRIVDNLQRGAYIPGDPILNFVPGYAALNTALGTLPGGYRTANILRGLPLAILVPWLVLRFLGLRPETLTFDRKDLKPALPFLVIYGIAFVATGIDFERLLFLGYALLYAGVQEEFFFRGVMQPLFTAQLRSSTWGLFAATLLFALLHIPDYLFRLYSAVPMALSGVASVAMFGVLMGYGVYRTGLLWPWMMIHALSNVLGW